jgi:pimeloyl-ACP methyl ester carboxylesterase
MRAATPIFIPGLLCTDYLFARQRAALPVAGQIADTLQFDSITAMAEAALESVDGKLVPVGLSMGGYVALEMLRLAPDRIAAMALLSTNCREDTEAQRDQRRAAIKMSEHKGFQGVTRHLLPRLLSDRARTDDALVEAVLQMARDVGRRVFANQQKAIMIRQPQHQTLAAFKAPLLVLCGNLDVLTPPELAVEMAALAPQAELCLLDDVGHLSSLEAPELVTAALRRLFETLA